MTSPRCLMLAVVLSLTAGNAASADSGTCPVRAPDLDRLTRYRWQVAQYHVDAENTDAALAKIFPQVVAAAAVSR